jgi:uridine monophosphate synthetase
MLLESNESLAVKLYDIGAVQFGKFKLHSGMKSPIYMDLRVLVSFPVVLRDVAQAYMRLFTALEFDILAAYPYAALPIGTAIALESGKPLIYPRKEVKSYGTGKMIEGVWNVGQRALLIEDLVTSGASIIQAFATLKAVGIQVNEALVLIDREQGGADLLQAQGYKLHSVMTLSEMLSVLEQQDRIDNRQRSQVLNWINKA